MRLDDALGLFEHLKALLEVFIRVVHLNRHLVLGVLHQVRVGALQLRLLCHCWMRLSALILNKSLN